MEKFEKYPDIFRIQNQIKQIKRKISKNKSIIKDIKNKKKSNRTFKYRTKLLYNSELKKAIKKQNELIKAQFNYSQFNNIDLDKAFKEHNSSKEKLTQDTRQLIDIRILKNADEMKLVQKSLEFCKEDNKKLKEEVRQLIINKKKMWMDMQRQVINDSSKAKLELKELKNTFKIEKKQVSKEYKSDKKKVIDSFKEENPKTKFVRNRIWKIKTQINLRSAKKIDLLIQNLYIEINLLKRKRNMQLLEMKKRIVAMKDNIRYIKGKGERFTVSDFSNKVSKFTNKLAEKNIISAISYSFMKLLPFVIFSSFIIVIGNVILSPASGIMSLFDLSENAIINLNKFTEYLYIGRYATVGLFSLALSALIGSTLSYKLNGNSHTASILCVITTLMFSPLLMYYVFKYPSAEEAPSVLNSVRAGFNELGSMGIFMATITSVLTTFLFVKLSKIKALQINIKSQNQNVVNSFRDLWSVIIILIIFFSVQLAIFGIGEWIGEIEINGVVDKLNTIPKYIKLFFSSIVINPSNDFFGMISYLFFTNFIWVFGIEQSVIAEPFYNIQGNLLHENAQILAGADGMTPHIFTNFFNTAFINIGGQGMIASLIIAILMFSNKKDAKKIALLAVIPAIFNINEPVMFGLPILFNVIYGSAFVIVPIVCGTISYLLTYIGFVNLTHINNMYPDESGNFVFYPDDRKFLDSMWIYPVFVQGWVTTESYSSLALIAINISVGTAIYGVSVWFDNQSEVGYKISDPSIEKIQKVEIKETTVMKF